MLSAFITTLFGLFVSSTDAGALRSTAPNDLPTIEAARDHLAAATIAAISYDVDRELLLSIAHHESRYQAGEITDEPGHRVSCGVMTPRPVARCTDLSLLGGYLAGAAHLREWLDVYRGHLRSALLGYAGGGEHGLVAACRKGPVIIRSGVDACGTAAVFQWRATKIRRAIAKARQLSGRNGRTSVTSS